MAALLVAGMIHDGTRSYHGVFCGDAWGSLVVFVKLEQYVDQVLYGLSAHE